MLNIFGFGFAPSDLVFSVNRPVCLLDGYSYFMSEKPQRTGDDCDYTIPGEESGRMDLISSGTQIRSTYTLQKGVLR